MKKTFPGLLAFLILICFGLAALQAQTAPTSADASGPITLSQPDLEQLVAPIALYPDPLIAVILPASTVPTDVVLASRFISNGGSADDIDAQPWDPSVKALARYPDVLQMMDENLDWTNQLGAAVLAQQADVMAAIQSQRAKAQQLGNLQTTEQQKVVADDHVIQIVPADPQVIYVPVYDPQVVYVQAPPPAYPFITFGTGFAIGVWLGGDCDWRNRNIYSSGYYRPGYGWGYRHPNNNYYWRPNPHRPPPRPPYRPGRPGGQLPGWRPPPNWGKPGHPGGRPPGIRPGQPGRPGADRPLIQPYPGPGGQTRPKPNQPGIKPLPGNDFNHGKPNTKHPTRPVQPIAQPGVKPAPTRPKPTSRPAPEIKPAPKPAPVIKPAPRPQPQPKPQPKPQVKPQPRPQPAQQPFNHQRPNTKQPAHAQPKPQARPQPRPQAPANTRQRG